MILFFSLYIFLLLMCVRLSLSLYIYLSICISGFFNFTVFEKGALYQVHIWDYVKVSNAKPSCHIMV